MKKALVATVALVAATYGTVSWIKGGDAPATKPAEISALDRVWIDHIPRNDRDIINVFIAITEEPFGVFQAGSQWTGKFELFRYEGKGKELRIHYPQTGEHDKVSTSARECNANGFDYCLDIGGASRGVKKYFSMEGWEVNGRDPAAVRARVEQIVVDAQRINK
jgi:hypothetical protein